MSMTLSIPFVAEPAVTRHPWRDAIRHWCAARAERRRMREARYEFAHLDARLRRDIGFAGDAYGIRVPHARSSWGQTQQEIRDAYLHLAA
jgi:hypothetical protein